MGSSASTAAWIAIGAGVAALFALLLAVWHVLALRRVRSAQLTLLGIISRQRRRSDTIVSVGDLQPAVQTGLGIPELRAICAID